MLSDRKVQSAKPKDKSYRLFDGGGLALLVQPTGVKSWQFRYRARGRAGTATLGKLTALSLAEARVAADKARKLLDRGEHPTAAKRVAQVKKAADNAATFGTVRFRMGGARGETRSELERMDARLHRGGQGESTQSPVGT